MLIRAVLNAGSDNSYLFAIVECIVSLPLSLQTVVIFS